MSLTLEIVEDLNKPIIALSSEDTWTLREATQGVQIFGAIGSGKSSGSGQALAKTFLAKGMGGIVLTGKVGERDVWRQYAKETKREQDIIIFSEDNTLEFNPLDYESYREGSGAGKTENIVDLFMTLATMGDRINGGGGQSKEPFWDLAMKRCLRSAVDLLKVSEYSVSMENIVWLIQSAPNQTEENLKVKFSNLIDSKESNEAQEWIEESFVIRALFEAFDAINDDDEEQKMVFRKVKDYFLSDFPRLSDNVRTSILEMVYAYADPFLTGVLNKYFSSGISEELLPEQTFEGKVIILDFPVKEYLQTGIIAQMIYKKIWQQAVERRKVSSTKGRAVFMWVDEAQYFLTPDDMMFQTTARSSKACTVCITQNISNYYASIGGSNPKMMVDSILGNLVTKIFHANNDYVTNQWASETIGKVKVEDQSLTTSGGGAITVQNKLEYQVFPEEFTRLRTGAEVNNFKVDAIITSVGRTWKGGKNYLRTNFYQK